MTPIVEVSELKKSFGRRAAVAGVDLSVPRGEIVCFLGANGSGKTTTMRMICGLVAPDEGRGAVMGFCLRREAADIRARTGYMTQRFSLYDDLTVRENLSFVAEMHGLRHPRQRVRDVIDRLDLGERRRQRAGTLSGGWKQRLALAAAVIHRPRLLLLDEPTAGVDPGARRDFWVEIDKLAAGGMTVLFSTHYMDEAERSHRLLYFMNGRIVLSGSAEALIADSGLAVYRAEGPNLGAIAEVLRGHAGVDQVARFGRALHVIGADEPALKTAIGRHGDGVDLRWGRREATIEDVVVHLPRRVAN